jgi:hypothetical protein
MGINRARVRAGERLCREFSVGDFETAPKQTFPERNILIWLALSFVIAACVCRLLALSGPGSPEKVIHTGYSESFSHGHDTQPF